MSHWVHVAAIVRLDALRLNNESFVDEIKAHFGKSTEDYEFDLKNEKKLEAYCKAMEEYSEHPDQWLPGGSEGTCEMHVYETPDTSRMAAYAVSIHGSLRDVDTGEHIIEWFQGKLSKKALEDKHFWVRQAVITVEEEYTGQILTWVWKEGEQE